MTHISTSELPKNWRGWLRRRWIPERQNSKRSPHWGRGGVCV